jgi:hypothetical protein
MWKKDNLPHNDPTHCSVNAKINWCLIIKLSVIYTTGTTSVLKSCVINLKHFICDILIYLYAHRSVNVMHVSVSIYVCVICTSIALLL